MWWKRNGRVKNSEPFCDSRTGAIESKTTGSFSPVGNTRNLRDESLFGIEDGVFAAVRAGREGNGPLDIIRARLATPWPLQLQQPPRTDI